MAKVPGFPLDLWVDSEFTYAQRYGIVQAAQKWNELGQRLIGGDFFRVLSARISPRLRSANPRDCNGSFGARNGFAVLRESSESRWKGLGFGDDIPGATLRCFGEREVSQQIVLIYTESIKDDSQVASVAIHELGHVLGLDHSCSQNQGRESYLACAGLPDSHPYHVAVMYPSLRMASKRFNPEIKDTLRANDVLRAECLYLQ